MKRMKSSNKDKRKVIITKKNKLSKRTIKEEDIQNRRLTGLQGIVNSKG